MKDKTSFTIKSCKQFKLPSNHLKFLPLPSLSNVLVIQLHYHIDCSGRCYYSTSQMEEGGTDPTDTNLHHLLRKKVTSKELNLFLSNIHCSQPFLFSNNFMFHDFPKSNPIYSQLLLCQLWKLNYKVRLLLTNSSQLRVAVEVFLLHSRFLLRDIC